MTLPRFALLLSFALAVCVSLPAGAQEASQTYRELREALLAEGWKPDVHYGLKDNAGRALYRFPEVLCGPQICNARWVAKGQEKLVKILRGYGAEEYRVLP